MALDVAVIDYKISNMFSVCWACSQFGLEARITADRDEILTARSAILPGVGAFAPAMEHLTDLGLVPVIHEFISTGRPFMGICLGMQLLLSRSEEFGIHQGLNIVPGAVQRFPAVDSLGAKVRVPHMGWNTINTGSRAACAWPVAPLSGVRDGAYMYFIHSFYAVPDDSAAVAATTEYAGMRFCSSLAHKNIFACQYHPEKSGKEGLGILKNFSESIKNAKTGHAVL